MSKSQVLLTAVVMLATLHSDAVAQPPISERPTITVAAFEFGAASAASAAPRPDYRDPRMRRRPDGYGGYDEAAFVETMGVGAADLVTEKLVASERFRVFERKLLDAVTREQKLAAQDGDTVLRARYMVTGSVTHLGMNDKDVGGTAVSLASGMLLRGVTMVRTRQSSTTVKLTARVVDTRTGEIIGSFTGEGESKRRWGVNVLGAGRGGIGAVNSNDRNFRETAIGEAMSRAANAIAEQVVALRATTLRP